MPITKTPQPNILFLFTDEHRPDALGCAGNPIIQTPHIDSLAAAGARFTRTYCQYPLCLPSRTSVITGRHAHQHGVMANRGTVGPDAPNMMKCLQAAGYTTAKAGKFHFHNPRQFRPEMRDDPRSDEDLVRPYGFDWALEEYDKYVHVFPGAETHYTRYLKQRGLWDTYRNQVLEVDFFTRGTGPERAFKGATSALSQDSDLTTFIGDNAIDWLRQYDSDNPFFLWVSFVAPHPPLFDDPIWAQTYKDAQIPLGPRQRPQCENGTPWDAYLARFLATIERLSSPDILTDDYIIESARHYYGMISLIDQKIGDILATLDQCGLRDNTWVLMSSDHGESLGDHGLMAKDIFYRSSVLVPSIVTPPGGMAPLTIDCPTQSIDLTSTILDIAGAPPLEGASGTSLLPLINGTGKPHEVAFSELSAHNQLGMFVMAATERYRYTSFEDGDSHVHCELFDLKDDPDEINNLVHDPACAGLMDDMHKDYIGPLVEGWRPQAPEPR